MQRKGKGENMLAKDEIKQNRNKILATIRKIERHGIDDLVKWLEGSDFFTAPASTMFHGNFEGGLAAHSYKVYEEFKRQVEHYGLKVPYESAAIAGILHDSCKINYYTTNELKSGNVSKSKPYKVEDNFPIGHGEKSVMLVQRHIELTPQEALIMRWHMGDSDPAWADYKDMVEKTHPEVTLFQHVDKEVAMLYKL